MTTTDGHPEEFYVEILEKDGYPSGVNLHKASFVDLERGRYAGPFTHINALGTMGLLVTWMYPCTHGPTGLKWHPTGQVYIDSETSLKD